MWILPQICDILNESSFPNPPFLVCIYVTCQEMYTPPIRATQAIQGSYKSKPSCGKPHQHNRMTMMLMLLLRVMFKFKSQQVYIIYGLIHATTYHHHHHHHHHQTWGNHYLLTPLFSIIQKAIGGSLLPKMASWLLVIHPMHSP